MNGQIASDRQYSKPPGFDALCFFLKRMSGISLRDDKQYLVEAKLAPILLRERLRCLADLVNLLEMRPSSSLASEVIETMTVNETHFFRDKVPFEKVRDVVLPAIAKARAEVKKMRIWCAACSTGQEPYSLAMLVAEADHLFRGWNVQILGTDLADSVLQKARAGVYTAFDVQRGLPDGMLSRHMRLSGGEWEVSRSLRELAIFRRLNLLDDFSNLGAFDLIFCRNVLIYFDAGRKRDVLGRLARVMAPDGYLTLGSAEGISGSEAGLIQDPAHQFFRLHKHCAT